jgi:hypothetical protein
MLGPPKSDSERGEEGCLSFKEELEIWRREITLSLWAWKFLLQESNNKIWTEWFWNFYFLFSEPLYIIKVTRLGEFSPFVLFLTLGCFLNTEVALHNVGVTFPRKSYVLDNFDRKWIVLCFGRFSHKLIGSPWL